MNKKKEVLVQIMWELAGSIFYAIGIYNFALQAEFPMTGFSGISIILYHLNIVLLISSLRLKNSASALTAFINYIAYSLSIFCDNKGYFA